MDGGLGEYEFNVCPLMADPRRVPHLCRKSLLRDVEGYVKEHYPASPVSGVFPYENDHSIAIAIVGNKYSPSNFW